MQTDDDDRTSISGVTPEAARDPVPDLFADRYRIVALLGSGGFGTVYRAHDTKLRIDVALKVTNAAAADDTALQRFEREARVIARLNHENIVKIYDYGVHRGCPFYTMDLVEGDTLQKIAELNRRLPWRAAVRAARDVALALHHAHLQGIVHRDVKPQNVIVQPQGEAGADGSISSSHGVFSQFRVVLTDFGLAKDEGAATRLSLTGDVMGTPQYMSPEQASGDPVGPQTDVYSTGVVLYFMLSGRLPFIGSSLHDLLAKVRTEDAPKLGTLVPGLPRDLCAIAEKAIEKELPHRYRSALDFAQDCENFLKGDPVSARPPPLARRLRRKIARRPALSASVGSAIGVAVAALIYALWIAPAIRDREARRAFETKRAAFEARKARIEADAAALLAGGRPLEMVEDYEAYSLAATFPRASFDWDDRFESGVPFAIPVVDAYLQAARAREREGQVSDALSLYLKAYFAGAERADVTRPEFEIACHYLRQEAFDQAVHFFRKVLETRDDDRQSAYLLGFAYSGAGRHDEAVAAFEAALDAGMPAALPPMDVEGPMAPMYALAPSRERIEEAMDLSRMFVGPIEVCPWSSSMAFTVADLDGDGVREVLVGHPGGVDVYAFETDRFVRVQRLALDSPMKTCTLMRTHDLDGDGAEEILFRGDDYVGLLLKPAGDRLETIARLDGLFDAAFKDVDGDGRLEIVVQEYHGFRIYKRDGATYRSIAHRDDYGSDIGGFRLVDLDGDGREEILFCATIWSRKNELRIHAVRIDLEAGDLTPIAVRPVGFAYGPIALLADGGILLNKQSRADAARTIELRYEEMGVRKELGLCRIDFRDGEFSEPALVWGRPVDRLGEGIGEAWSFDSRGRTYVLAHFPQERARRLIGLSEDPWPYLPLQFEDARKPSYRYRGASALDLDGDGRPEMFAVFDDRLVAYGLRRGAVAGRTSDVELSRDPTAVRVQDALQSVAGFLERGDTAGAIEFLQELAGRIPAFEKEILLRIAGIQDDAHDWAGLVGTLERVRRRFRLDAGEAEQIDDRKSTAEALAGMPERFALDFRAAPLITNAPLRYRIDPRSGELRAFGRDGVGGFLGIACAWDGASYALDARFRLWHLDFISGVTIGLSAGVERFQGPWNYAFMARDWAHHLALWSWGTFGQPGTNAHLQGYAEGFEAPEAWAWNVPVRPSASSHELSLSYVRHRDELRATLRGAAAPPVELQCDVRYRYQAPAGSLLISDSSGSYGQFWYEIEMERLVVRSSGVFHLRDLPEPSTILDHAFRAGGLFVKGDFAGAVDGYDETLRRFESDRPRDEEFAGVGLGAEAFRRETLFHLAFAHHALGNREEADAGMVEVFAAGMPEAVGLLKNNFAAMTREEIGLFRRAFRAASAGREYDAVFNEVVASIGSPRGDSGLQVIEILFFTEPEDPARALKAWEGLRRWVQSAGMNFGVHQMVLLRCAARVYHAMGRVDEAVALLDEALDVADSKSVDEFYRVPFKRDFEALRREWDSDF